MEKLRQKLFVIIFEANTPAGKLFDIILLAFIALSTALVMLESVQAIQLEYGTYLKWMEWVITGIFTIEYLLRLLISHRPLGYAFSFFGIVDLVAILPQFLSFFLVGSHNLMIVRVLRLLRVFRILKFSRYTREGKVLLEALRQSRPKLTVFVTTVFTLVLIFGSIMYLVEGEQNGFTSIPQSAYWAIVTLTTVGYGDIAPQTDLGRFISSVVMIVGYAIIAIPTGIVGYEISRSANKAMNTKVCSCCFEEGHERDAKYCRVCGDKLIKKEDF